ncbi:isochorismate synthase [Halococcoides cellulosivorans]|uniref:isochorismate synthase n=1 Tax=Halococcoides cellulosivorans TaxID=1679096 RepID=A0A2R4X2C4_9EURY|nr:isochorismate synthase [Halococcoides cellulosivorans]AWB27863.1 isochorismate synthase [Halococcoides cellulosivorans]
MNSVGESAVASGGLTTRAERIADGSVLAAFDGLDRPRMAWLRADERRVVGGQVARVTAAGSDRFETIEERATATLATVDTTGPAGQSPRWYGGAAFTPDSESWAGFAPAAVVLPAVVAARVDGETWLVVRGRDRVDARFERLRMAIEGQDPPAHDPPGIDAVERRPDRMEWIRQVERVTDAIGAGQLRKVVLARSLHADLGGPVGIGGALADLGDRYPDCTRFAVAPVGGGTFLGATPEILLDRRGRTVTTTALAGSAARGGSRAADADLAAELQASAKDDHEHRVVVDAIVDQLESLPASVSVADRRLRRLASVQHLETPIEATLDTDVHALSVADALHPTPAVGGQPPDRAMMRIADLEGIDRGWYAAPVGWFDATGDGSFAVAIRSALIEGRRAHCFAGAGLVADSDPDAEWSETELKYRPMLDLLE